MFKKLDKMLERFEKLNELVANPEVLAKMDEWKAYSKELSDMQETVDEYLKYKKTVKESEELNELISLESDTEMKALYEEEAQSLKKQIEEILHSIGAPVSPEEIGIDCDMATTIKATKDIRFKYIISNLLWDFGKLDETL